MNFSSPRTPARHWLFRKQAAYRVRAGLGVGLLERNYRLALETELRFRGIGFSSEKKCEAVYRGVSCGAYYIDLLVEDLLVVELKACRKIDKGHFAQTYNYMRLAGVRDGLIVNFGESPVGIRRLSVGQGSG